MFKKCDAATWKKLLCIWSVPKCCKVHKLNIRDMHEFMFISPCFVRSWRCLKYTDPVCPLNPLKLTLSYLDSLTFQIKMVLKNMKNEWSWSRSMRWKTHPISFKTRNFIWAKFDPIISLQRGTIFEPNTVPSSETNWISPAKGDLDSLGGSKHVWNVFLISLKCKKEKKKLPNSSTWHSQPHSCLTCN